MRSIVWHQRRDADVGLVDSWWVSRTIFPRFWPTAPHQLSRAAITRQVCPEKKPVSDDLGCRAQDHMCVCSGKLYRTPPDKPGRACRRSGQRFLICQRHRNAQICPQTPVVKLNEPAPMPLCSNHKLPSNVEVFLEADCVVYRVARDIELNEKQHFIHYIEF